LLKRALVNATVVLTVSEFTKNRICELLGIVPDKIRVVGNGVEEGFFEVYHQNPIDISPFGIKPYVLSVGGITKKKGGEDLLKFAKALEKVDSKIRLIVVGSVDPQFEGGVRQTQNIQVLRRGIQDAQMQKLVRGAIASVILSEYEGFGIPALEAMAAGVPIIASRKAALPEVVADAGILVDPSCSKEIADIIRDLSIDHVFRDSFIKKGRERARLFTWKACVERLCSVLEEFGPGREFK
jgi:glycosyltransferase involved in cell wall biosynthesis